MKSCLFFILLGFTTSQSCARIDVRKEIRDLSQQERNDFLNAIKQLNSGSQPTEYDKVTKIHIDNNLSIHYKPSFFPWHRHYLHHMQTLLRKINPNIVMPYWDWARDSQAPERSEIFSDQFFGSTGTQSSGYCIPSGPFSDFKVYYRDEGTESRCLRRSFDNGDKLSAFAAPELLQQVKNDNPSFDKFAQNFERLPHALPHNYIGGSYGDMSQHSSPNDPLFWIHHGFVDRAWSEWQVQQGEGAFEYSTSSSLSEPLSYFNGVTVENVLDTRAYPYCYTYAGLGELPTRSNLNTTEKSIPVEPSNPSSSTKESTPSNPSSQVQPPISNPPTITQLEPPSVLNPPTTTSSQVQNPISNPSTSNPWSRPRPFSPRRKTPFLPQAQIITSRFFVPNEVIQRLTSSFFQNGLFRRTSSIEIPKTSYGDIDSFKKALKKVCPPNLCPLADDRENKDKLRVPTPIPERWIKMFHGSVDDVRQKELEAAKVYYKYNSNPKYISKASLRYWSSYHSSSSSSRSASSSSKQKSRTKRTIRTVTTRRVIDDEDDEDAQDEDDDEDYEDEDDEDAQDEDEDDDEDYEDEEDE